MRKSFNSTSAAVILVVLMPFTLRGQDLPLGTSRGSGYPAFQLGIFGNADIILEPPAGERPAFRNGALDLFVTSQLSERWSGLVELVFENLGGELVTDLERYQISYDYSELFRVTLGRIHNPLVQWNVTQHHGVFLQTPIDKPAMTEWEDVPGLWPVHFVGGLVSGRILQAFGLTYMFGVGNGRGEILDEIQVVADRNRHKAVILGLGFRPATVTGLEFGVTGYLDRLTDNIGDVDERDLTVSATYAAFGVELRGEWSRMRHERENGPSYNTTGWYGLASMKLPGSLEILRPYVLIDRLDTPVGFELFEGAVDQSNWSAGVRLDVNEFIALKADYRSQRFGDADRDGLVRFQLAFSLN